MKEYLEFLTFILTIPLCIILWKLVEYLWDKPFKEWWVTLMWIFILALVSLSIAGVKHNV